MAQQLELAGKVALITGAARGIGSQIAKTLAQAGAAVAIHYNTSGTQAEQLAGQLDRPDRQARIYQGNLCQVDQAAALVPKVLEDFGRLDVLVNNASVFYRHDIDELTDRHWQEMIQLHMLAPFKLSMAAREALARQGGQIINIADIWGLRPRAKMLAYSVTKAAMIALTYALADAMAPQIRVNAIAPGIITWPDELGESKRQEISARIPMGKPGQGHDVARAVLFVCTDASYVTGQVLAVDGGRSINWA